MTRAFAHLYPPEKLFLLVLEKDAPPPFFDAPHRTCITVVMLMVMVVVVVMLVAALAQVAASAKCHWFVFSPALLVRT